MNVQVVDVDGAMRVERCCRLGTAETRCQVRVHIFLVNRVVGTKEVRVLLRLEERRRHMRFKFKLLRGIALNTVTEPDKLRNGVLGFWGFVGYG